MRTKEPSTRKTPTDIVAWRRFLRDRFRFHQRKGCPLPRINATLDLAARLGIEPRELSFAAMPPEWEWRRAVRRLRRGWWHVKDRGWRERRERTAGWMNKHRRRCLNCVRCDDILRHDWQWIGGSELVSIAEGRRRRAEYDKRIREDARFELARLRRIAEVKGVTIYQFCPDHGDRLFRCRGCSPLLKHPKHGGHANGYASLLRKVVFGDDAMSEGSDRNGVPEFWWRRAKRRGLAA